MRTQSIVWPPAHQQHVTVIYSIYMSLICTSLYIILSVYRSIEILYLNKSSKTKIYFKSSVQVEVQQYYQQNVLKVSKETTYAGRTALVSIILLWRNLYFTLVDILYVDSCIFKTDYTVYTFHYFYVNK